MEKRKARLIPMAMSMIFMACSIFSLLMICPNQVFAVAGLTSNMNTIYANGNPITLRESPVTPGYTQIFLGNSTTPEVLTGLTASGTRDAAGGYDLRSCYLYGGSSTEAVNATSITMEGGAVGNIYGGGYKQSVIGDTNVTISGGTVTYKVFGGAELAEVTGATNVTINGGTMVDVYGGGSGTTSNSAVGSANVILNGGVIEDVYAGGFQLSGMNLSVTGLALIRRTADATILGNIRVDANGGWYLNTRSVQYEVAFYDGTTKLTVPSSQWLEIGIANLGKAPTTSTVPPTQPADPTAEGKTFTGWEKADGSAYDFNVNINAPQKVYASWTYTAIYKDNGSTGGTVPVDATVYSKGDTVNLSDNPGNLTKTGYTFGGWSTTPGGTPITLYTIDSAAAIFYAVWNPIPTYAVTYNGNGNTGGTVPTDSTSYLTGTNVQLAGNTGNLTKTGYTFAGWSTTAGGTAITSYTIGTAPVTLYAIWTADPANNNNNSNTGSYTTTSRTPSLKTASGTGQTISGALQAAPSGGTVEVNMNDSATLQSDWLSAIAGKDVNLVLDMGNGVKWTINGKSVTGTNFTSLNLAVSTNSNVIPGSVLNNLTGERKAVQFTVTHSGNFGFTATLSVGLGKENKGLFANLYYYNEATKKMEFQSASPIGEDGSAAWNLKHASSYAVVIDKVSLAPTELSAGASAEDNAIASNTLNKQWGFAALAVILSAAFVLSLFAAKKRRVQ